MDLNRIDLNPLMLADLYGDLLVETGVAQAIKAAPAAPLKLLGENRRNTIVVVDHVTAPVLPDGELNFLTTILAACKLSLADIAIVNRHTAAPDALRQLLEAPTRHILLFGVEPLAIGLPINFPHFQVQPFSQRTWLHAPPLGAIESDKGLKLQLWNGLKQLFDL